MESISQTPEQIAASWTSIWNSLVKFFNMLFVTLFLIPGVDILLNQIFVPWNMFWSNIFNQVDLTGYPEGTLYMVSENCRFFSGSYTDEDPADNLSYNTVLEVYQHFLSIWWLFYSDYIPSCQKAPALDDYVWSPENYYIVALIPVSE